MRKAVKAAFLQYFTALYKLPSGHTNTTQYIKISALHTYRQTVGQTDGTTQIDGPAGLQI